MEALHIQQLPHTTNLDCGLTLRGSPSCPDPGLPFVSRSHLQAKLLITAITVGHLPSLHFNSYDITALTSSFLHTYFPAMLLRKYRRISPMFCIQLIYGSKRLVQLNVLLL